MLSIPERQAAARSGSRMMHGGYTNVRPLSAESRSAMNALIDTMIPPEDGWPSATDLRIADLAAVYLTPDDAELSLYPHFRLTEFFDMIAGNIGEMAELTPAERAAALGRFEQADAALFSRVRDFVYYVYYGHEDVVELIRQRTRHGKEFHGRPQPIGYDAVLENWGSRSFTTRGVFFTTDSVLATPQARKVSP
ncbi:hypothetical protein LFT48_21930 (plasmid) [Arthrobacter sp. FW305-123]|jgi:hypothetical protein|nr:hypothetical protein LFT48_21930 [Arthrobacter sp. FW305-123]